MYTLEAKVIKERSCLLEVASRNQVKLKKVGKCWMGCCPFHEDKIPSLVINPDKQLFYCFGCGLGGDIFTFVQKLFRYEFYDSLKYLSHSNVHTVSKPRPHIKPRVKEVDNNGHSIVKSKAMVNVVAKYHESLLENTKALSYLYDRGISDLSLLEELQVGFSDGSFITVLKNSGVQFRKQLSGSVVSDDDYKPREFFQNCITFPFFDEHGFVGDIYGRQIFKTDRKHRYLPGTHMGIFNRFNIKKEDNVFLCESVIDSLSLMQMGIKNTTCTFGKGVFTKELLSFLSKTVKAVTLCYDNDGKGKDPALERSIQKLENEGLEVKVINIPRRLNDVNSYLVHYLKRGMLYETIKEKFLSLVFNS